MRQGPWTGRYPAAAAMVVFALVPYLALSAALAPITPIIAKDLHMSLQAMSLTLGIANPQAMPWARSWPCSWLRPSPAADAGPLCRAAATRVRARRGRA